MRKSNRTCVLFFIAFFFASSHAEEVTAQVSSAARREAARLERLASGLWDTLLEDVDSGYSMERGTLLDVFNFANGARFLSQKAESLRTSLKEINDIVEFLSLQARVVDRALQDDKPTRHFLRDWEELKNNLDSLARLVTPRPEPFLGWRESPQVLENANNLKIEVKEVRHTGNIFGNDYRVRGVISGRNIVSAGIYHEERLVKPISARLNDPSFTESAFEIRIEAPAASATVRAIDNRGFVLERTIEFPGVDVFPGFK